MSTSKWISQTNAILEYGLNVDLINANIASVIKSDLNNDFKISNGNLKITKVPDVKIVKNPQVPLTLRLVPNPRGYMYPMRLYNRDQLKKLAELKGCKSRIGEEKVVKSIKKNKKKVKKKEDNEDKGVNNDCNINGHEYINVNDNIQECKLCKIQVEVFKI